MNNSLIFLLSIIVVGCTYGLKQPDRKIKVYMITSFDPNRLESVIFCDSVKMKSRSTADVFIDGVKSPIMSEVILVGTNDDYRK